MKKIIIGAILLISFVYGAEETFKSSGSVTFLTKYIKRGVDVSNGKTAVHGRIHLNYYNVFAGVMGTTRYSTNPYYSSEFNQYAGFGLPIGPVAINLGYLDVRFPDASSQNYGEVFIGTMISLFEYFALSMTGSQNVSTNRLADFNTKLIYSWEFIKAELKYGSDFQSIDYYGASFYTYAQRFVFGIHYDISSNKGGGINTSAVTATVGMAL